MSFIAALRFLTIIPVFKSREVTPQNIGRSLTFFPVVGLLIGLVLAGFGWILSFILPVSFVSVILLVGLVILTGGIHLDGLADTCDGLGGHNVEDRLRIMKDSRIGTFGAISVVMVLLLKFVALINLPVDAMVLAMTVMPTISRGFMVYAIYHYSYPRPSGIGKVMKQNSGLGNLLIATIVTVAVSVIVVGWQGIIILLVACLITMGAAALLAAKFGGLTGDGYGALNELTETVVLGLVVLMSYNNWLF